VDKGEKTPLYADLSSRNSRYIDFEA